MHAVAVAPGVRFFVAFAFFVVTRVNAVAVSPGPPFFASSVCFVVTRHECRCREPEVVFLRVLPLLRGEKKTENGVAQALLRGTRTWMGSMICMPWLKR